MKTDGYDVIIEGVNMHIDSHDLNRFTPGIQHENLHNRFCVCVQVMRVSPSRREKSDFSENGYFQWFARNGKKPSTCIDSRTCWNYQHELLSHAISMLSINQSINQSIM